MSKAKVVNARLQTNPEREFSQARYGSTGNTYTQIEALDRMIEWTGFYLRNRDDPDRYDESLEGLQRATRLWEPFLAYAWR